jgi:hypothetical protein
MFGEMKPDFFMKQNEHGVYFSSMYPMKKPVYKIYSSFMSCVIVCALLLSYMNTSTAV